MSHACADEMLSPKVVLLRGSDVQPEAVDWIWNGWLAADSLQLIAGAPATGKSTLAISLASALTAGAFWPDGAIGETGSVIFWSGEDDIQRTIAPRFIAAGADMNRVYFIEGVEEGGERYSFDPAKHVEALRETLMRQKDVRLIVIDPLVSVVSGDSHKNTEVRRSLQPLVDLAKEYRCGVLGVTHFTKGTAGRDPLERVTGSLAFGAVARVVMVTAKQDAKSDRSEQRIIVRAKSNLGPDGGGFEYELQQLELRSHTALSASAVVWGKRVFGSAREILARAELENSRGRSSVTFLSNLLAHGPRAVLDIEIEAAKAAYSIDSMKRAKNKLKVISRKNGMKDGWTWELPSIEDGAEQREERAHLKSRSSLPSEITLPTAHNDTEDYVI